MVRSDSDPETRLRILLEAVHWGCEFYSIELGRGDLRDLKITPISEVDSPAAVTDAVDDIFGRLPPRRGRRRDRTRDDKAMELTYALARKHEHSQFFQTARRLKCRKVLDSHEFKFMAAVFENYEHADDRIEYRRSLATGLSARDSRDIPPRHSCPNRRPARARELARQGSSSGVNRESTCTVRVSLYCSPLHSAARLRPRRPTR